MKFFDIFYLSSPNKITQDWYGHKELNIENMTLRVNEGYGVGANFFVLLGSLAQLKKVNLIPTKIDIKLKMYHDQDLFKEVFYISEEGLQRWKDFDVSKVEKFCNSGSACKSNIGIGNKHYEVTPHFETISCLLGAYFNFKENIINKANEIIKTNNLDLNNTTFIWWRKGNKPSEVIEYPAFSNVSPLLVDGHNNILQTDDEVVLDEFKDLKNKIVLDVLPIFKNDTFIDKEMNNQSPENYFNKYNKDYFMHVPDTFALALVASQCKRFIGYPGHMSQLVCILRRDFTENAFIIKNNKELF